MTTRVKQETCVCGHPEDGHYTEIYSDSYDPEWDGLRISVTCWSEGCLCLREWRHPK